MNDLSLTRSFGWNPSAVTRLPLKLMRGGTGENQIYFFSKAEAARSFLAHEESAKGRTFIVYDETVLPKEALRAGDSIYLLSTAQYFGGSEAQHPEWKSRLTTTLYRLFVLDQWEKLRGQNFSFYSDTEEALPILKDFLDSIYFQYQKFEETCLEFRKIDSSKEKGILVFNTDGDPILEAFFDLLKSKGRRVHRINAQSGWVAGRGYEGEQKFPSAESFANDLLSLNIGEVYFRNLYDMTVSVKGAISKVWLMERLQVKPVGLIIDSLIDGVNPIHLHMMPEVLEAVALHTTESFDNFCLHRSPKRIHRGVQIIPEITTEKKLKPRSKSLVGVVAATNSRRFLVDAHLRVSLLLLPLVKCLVERNLPIHLSYFGAIEAARMAETEMESKNLFSFLDQNALYSGLLRILIRYVLLSEGERIAKAEGFQFRLFGDDDWKKMFPTAFEGKFIERSELDKLLENHILFDPTPSTTYLSQHPIIPRHLFDGHAVLAPSTWDFAEAGSLDRFYFNTIADLPKKMAGLRANSMVSNDERANLLSDFGVENLVTAAKGECRRSLSHSEVLAKMDCESQGFVREFAAYSVSIFDLMIRKRSKKEVLAGIESKCPTLAPEVRSYIADEKAYLKQIRERFPYFRV